MDPTRDRPLRILLLLPSLHGGGAERVALHLMNHMDRRRYDVRMGLLETTGPYLQHIDPTLVDTCTLGANLMDFEKGNSLNYRGTRLLAGALLAPANVALMIRRHRPDVIVSFRKGMNLITYLARRMAMVPGVRWVCREGNNTFAVINDELQSPLARTFITKLTGFAYGKPDRLLTISHEMADDLGRGFSIPSNKIATIHNAVDLERVYAGSKAENPATPDEPYIVCVGRLEQQKGYDVLLPAYAASRSRHTHKLVILGTGSHEEKLRNLVRNLHIEDRVVFVGWTDNPWSWMKRADLFALPSRWEGFGNVVVEALACGLPAVVTDCKYGPKEIVSHNVDGLVVPVEQERPLREAIDEVAQNPNLRQRMSEAAQKRARAFEVEGVVRRYEALFDTVVGRSPKAPHLP